MPLSYYFVDFYEEIRAKAPIVNSHYRQIVIDETLPPFFAFITILTRH